MKFGSGMIVLAASAMALAGLPGAAAQDAESQLETFHFETWNFIIGWDTEKDRAEVVFSAENLVFTDNAASDIRHCIDADMECSMEEVRQISHGNQDGTVSTEEIGDLQDTLLVGLPTVSYYQQAVRQLRGIVKVDNLASSFPRLTKVSISGAEGQVGSKEPIHFSVELRAGYELTRSADRHHVSMLRTETNMSIADNIAVRAGKNWRIVEDSIKPVGMKAFVDRGVIKGTQDQFESPQPLEFDIEYHKASKSPGWGAVGGLLALVAVALVRRRKA